METNSADLREETGSPVVYAATLKNVALPLLTSFAPKRKMMKSCEFSVNALASATMFPSESSPTLLTSFSLNEYAASEVEPKQPERTLTPGKENG